MKKNTDSLLPRLAINRPVTVLMVLCALLVVGYIALTRIPVELMPAGFSPPFLGVWTPYPNSNPREVEEQIAKPIEEQVRTLSGVRSVSTSSSANGCWTFVRFSEGTDMDEAYAGLRDRMERVKSELPDDIERLFLRKWSNDDEPIFWVMLAEREPVENKHLLIEQVIQKPLERLDGIAKVDIFGADEKSIQIHIYQDRVKAHKINLFEVIQALRKDNFALSSGYISEGGRKIYVRSLGKFRSLDDIRNLPVKGTAIRLKDVADVAYEVPEKRWRNLVDGSPAVAIAIYKESTANTVALSQQLETLFEERFANDPRLKSFRIEKLFNQGEWIMESIDNLKRTGVWGGIFAFGVLFFFLRRLRMTLIVNLAIPLSVLVTIIVLYFSGWTLNLITMMGIMISIGMVVDNSIVVLENIYREIAAGKPRKEAALKGASEVGLAITMATLTTIVVFLPLILMSDDGGFRFFMLRIGLPVVVALLASLLIAMIFIPLAATWFSNTRVREEEGIVLRSNTLYQRLLALAIRHRVDTFVVLLLIIISMNYAASNAKYANESNGNINDIRLFFDIPDNFTIEDTEKVFAVVEDTIRARSTEYDLRTINSRFSANWGQMRVFLHKPPQKDWYEVLWESLQRSLGRRPEGKMTRDEVLADLKERLPKFPGVEIRTSWRSSAGNDAASVSVVLYGDDTGKLIELSKEVERRLRAIEDIISIETDREKGGNEIHLQIDREAARKYGISPQVISGTVQYALRGISLPKYHSENKEIDVHIQLREEDRKNLLQLKNMTFFSASGREIPLASLATFSIERGVGEIQRRNGKTFLSVDAFANSDDTKNLYEQVSRAMEGFAMPYGYSWSLGEGFTRMQEDNEAVFFAVILSMTFVYLIMGILFESFVLPLSVIVSMPFAFVGSFWMMYLTGTPIDIMSWIGLVILIGIVVNNAIVLIDLINRLRHSGMSRLDAILEAGRHRFRPILMTAFTTIGGLIPMAIGNSTLIGIPYSPMGRTIIGGLLTSTILSLIAVPLAYTIFDDMRIYFQKVLEMYVRGGGREEKRPMAALKEG